MPFYTSQGQCTYSVLLGRTPHGTNQAGVTHTQTLYRRVRGGREMDTLTQKIQQNVFIFFPQKIQSDLCK